MSAYLKTAWLQLFVCLGALAVVVGLGRYIGWATSPAGFAVLGLSGLAPLLTLPGRSKKVVADERDQAIQTAALRAAFAIVWIALFLAGTFVALSGDSIFPTRAIPIAFLPWVLVGLWMMFTASHSIAVIRGYSRKV